MNGGQNNCINICLRNVCKVSCFDDKGLHKKFIVLWQLKLGKNGSIFTSVRQATPKLTSPDVGEKLQF
jgi:hypothetical protein